MDVNRFGKRIYEIEKYKKINISADQKTEGRFPGNGESGFSYLCKNFFTNFRGGIKMAEVTFENEKYIISILKEIEYGSVTITLHAGKIAQIEREEKIRIQTDNHKK